VLAPAASFRDQIVPGAARQRATESVAPADCAAAHGCAPARRSNSRRSKWAELLLCVFSLDVLDGPHCGTRRKLIALIGDGAVVRKILDHHGLPSEPPILARARVSEELNFDA